MRISTNPKDITDIQLAKLYEAADYGTTAGYMTKDNLITRVFPSGAFGFFAISNKKELLGMIRVLSDDCICSWIAEMCIVPGTEFKEIANLLLRATITRFGHTALFSEAFDAELDLYKAVGVTPKKKLTAVSRAPFLELRTDPVSFVH